MTYICEQLWEFGNGDCEFIKVETFYDKEAADRWLRDGEDRRYYEYDETKPSPLDVIKQELAKVSDNPILADAYKECIKHLENEWLPITTVPEKGSWVLFMLRNDVGNIYYKAERWDDWTQNYIDMQNVVSWKYVSEPDWLHRTYTYSNQGDNNNE